MPPPPLSVSVCLSVCLSVSVSVSLCVCLSVSLSLSVSLCLSVSLSLSLSLSLSPAMLVITEMKAGGVFYSFNGLANRKPPFCPNTPHLLHVYKPGTPYGQQTASDKTTLLKCISHVVIRSDCVIFDRVCKRRKKKEFLRVFLCVFFSCFFEPVFQTSPFLSLVASVVQRSGTAD